MTGARILGLVVLVAGLLLWAALSGSGDSDLERGMLETDLAFEAVDDALAALQPDYDALRAQGLVLQLREEHDRVRSMLSELRSRRVEIENDADIHRRQRLPRLRELVHDADVALAMAVALHRRCTALVGLRADIDPLIDRALDLSAQIEERVPATGELSARAASLAGSLTDLHERAAMAERLIRENLEQGRAFGDALMSSLHRHIDELEHLLAELAGS